MEEGKGERKHVIIILVSKTFVAIANGFLDIAFGCQVMKDGLIMINLIILPGFGIMSETGL